MPGTASRRAPACRPGASLSCSPARRRSPTMASPTGACAARPASATTTRPNNTRSAWPRAGRAEPGRARGWTFSRPTRCGCGWSTAWRRFHPGWAPCSGRPLRWPRLARGPPGGRACCRYGSNWKWTCNPIRRSGRPGPMSPMATRGTATASPLRRQDSLAAILQ
ncbi:Uncharacterised protein [Bordetella pertussis]|nr:Uncharacterised protein [Bordetella pertussis]